MKKIILTLIFLIFVVGVKSQKTINVKIYDENYKLIDFENRKSLDQYETVYLDTSKYAFAPIDDLPNDIFELSNLKSITFCIVSDSVVDKIFLKLTKLKQLERLNIEGNNFNVKGIFEPKQYQCMSHIPKEINELKNLKVLRLKGHLISLLPIDSEQLNKLEKIELFRNKIHDFPIELCLLPNIKELGLENNYIDSIPPEICSCKSIKYLSLGRNSLKSIPLCLFDSNSIIELDLNENFFSEESIKHYADYLESKNKQMIFNVKDQKSLDSYPKYDPTLDILKKLTDDKK